MLDRYEEGNDVSKSSDEEILQTIHRQIFGWYTVFGNNYTQAREDKYFLLVTQWDSVEAQDLRDLNLPPLEFNKLFDYTKKARAQQMATAPSIKISSLDQVSTDESDEELMAEQKKIDLLQNMMRRLAYDSEGEEKGHRVFRDQIEMGFGAFVVYPEYEKKNAFQQLPRFKNINPELAYWDPSSVEIDKGDGDFCGHQFKMSRRKFKEWKPDIDPPAFTGYSPVDPIIYFQWFDADSVTIVNHFKKEYFKYKCVLLEDGRSMPEDEYKELVEQYTEQNYPIPAIVDEKTEIDYKIMHYQCIQDQILERTVFPGKILPVIFVDGDSFYYQGIQYTRSFCYYAKDAQRALNYTGVSIAQCLKNLRREPYLGTLANIRGHEDDWKNPERVQGILLAEPDPITKQLPIKQGASEISSSLMTNYQRLTNDIQSQLGMYAEMMGDETNAESGKAIFNRGVQGATSLGVYQTNLKYGLRAVGKCMLQMIPILYNSERRVSLMMHDGSSRSVMINKKLEDGTTENDLRSGLYDIDLDIGPSYELQKDLYVRTIIQLLQISPQSFNLVADAIVDNLPIQNRMQLVERFRTLVPPEILAKEQGLPPPPPAPPPPPPPQVMAAQINAQTKQAQLQASTVDQNLKQQDLQLQAARLMSDMEANRQDTGVRNLQSMAEMHKSQMDYKSNEINALSKIIDSTKESSIQKDKE